MRRGPGPAGGRSSGSGDLPAAPRVSLLNRFDVECGGQRIELPPSAQRILALVALREEPLARVIAAGTLWPEATEGRAAGNLRSALWRLRLSGAILVESSRSHLRLAESAEVDLRAMLGAARRLLGDESDPPGLDVGLLRAELLPGWYEDWLVVDRERVRQIQLHALEHLCARFTAAGRHGRAIEAGLAAVERDPLRESAHRVLIRAHAAEGNLGEAYRQFETYRALVEDELGLAPSFAIDTLVGDLVTASSLTG